MTRNIPSLSWLARSRWRLLTFWIEGHYSRSSVRNHPERWIRLVNATQRRKRETMRMRRFRVVAYTILLSFFPAADAWLVSRTGDRAGPAHSSWMLFVPLFLAWVTARDFQRRLHGSDLLRYTFSRYGSDFLTLEESRRTMIVLEYLSNRGQLPETAGGEKENSDSRADAYRILSGILMIGLTAYWVFFMFRAPPNPRVALHVTADAATWVAAITGVLPAMISTWRRRDDSPSQLPYVINKSFSENTNRASSGNPGSLEQLATKSGI